MKSTIKEIIICKLILLLSCGCIHTKEALEEHVRLVGRGESRWFMTAMADSFENELIEQMAMEPRWAHLQGACLLDFTDYRSLFLENDLQICRCAVHREIIHVSKKWIEQEIFPRTGLPLSDRDEFVAAFLARAASQSLYRYLVVQVERV